MALAPLTDEELDEMTKMTQAYHRQMQDQVAPDNDMITNRDLLRCAMVCRELERIFLKQARGETLE